MFIDSAKVRSSNGKTYERTLLRTSFREDGKVKHRTLGNLSSCTPEEINAIRLALRHKDQLADLLAQAQSPKSASTKPQPSKKPKHFAQGPSVGAVAALAALAKELGITQVLGDTRQGRLALWQVIARALDQGSRLSAVRLARDLGASAVLGLPGFDEDDLYANLAWLEQNQQSIETGLYNARNKKNASTPSLFLYDVTSTYLEGQHNALAAFGYNRDGKRGKKQIVVGLLCDDQGIPLAIEAFAGNTGDTRTVGSQIAKLQERFKAEHVTLVGDRGMIRGPQIGELQQAGLHHISAISKPQVETMLREKSLQMELFDNELAEVIIPAKEGENQAPERYILRRNPMRQQEIMANRLDKKAALEREIEQLNKYLAEHPRAKASTAEKALRKRLVRLKLDAWLRVDVDGRHLRLEQDDESLAEISKLDGCYVIRTDLPESVADKHQVHARYKSLAQVEQAFRRSKTVELQMRPVHVRRESSTRGHLLVVMLAYLLMQELGKRWAGLDLTVSEGLDRLNTYCTVKIGGVLQMLLEPRQDVQELLTAANLKLPSDLPGKAARVATKKTLPKSRPTRIK
jgi:hypothetical protein